MSQSRKIGLGIAGALIIALIWNSGRIVLGQKEANPLQAEKGVVVEARKFVDLTDGERAIVDEIGNKVASLEELNQIVENLRRKMRRYSDLNTDIEFKLEANPPGLSARELEEMLKNLENRKDKVERQEMELYKQLRDLQVNLAHQKIELSLLAKKNGLPDPSSPQTADPSIESIERSLKAIEARLDKQVANAK